MELDLSEVGGRIRRALKVKGYTPAEVASLTGASRATVSQWFKGRNLTLNALEKLSGQLDISLNWIVFGLGDLSRASSLQITEKEEALLTITRHMENDVAPVISELFKSVARYNSGLTNIANQSRADQMFELARIARVCFLTDGTIVDANPFFRSTFGVEEQVPGDYKVNCLDLVDVVYRPHLKRMTEEVKAVGRSGYVYLQFLHFRKCGEIPVICKSSLTTWGNKLAFELLLKPVEHELAPKLF